MITNDFSFCNNVGFHICQRCKRNIEFYNDDLKKSNVWFLKPEIKMVNCEDFIEKDILKGVNK